MMLTLTTISRIPIGQVKADVLKAARSQPNENDSNFATRDGNKFKVNGYDFYTEDILELKKMIS